MASRKDPPSAKSLRPRPSDAYEVGYCKPPADARFKPGRSGNPRGRRKGSSNRAPALNDERLKSIILEEAYRSIKVTEGGRPVTIPMAQAIIRSLALAAAKGQQRSQRLFTELLSTTEQANKALHDGYLQDAIDYKAYWEDELERRRHFGIAAPDPIPHPDHIVIDGHTGNVRINGPVTKEQKVAWDDLRRRKRDFSEEVTEFTAMLKEESEEGMRRVILEQIQHAKKIVAIISKVIVD